MLSLLLIFFLIRLFPAYVGSSLGALRELVGFRFLTLGQSLALVFGGGCVGFLGSLSSLSRFLRI
jgi:cell division transport system permease protein